MQPDAHATDSSLHQPATSLHDAFRLQSAQANSAIPSMQPDIHATGSHAFGSVRSVRAVSLLASSFQQLVFDNGSVDTKSEAGFDAAAAFMESLAEAAAALGLDPTSRSYRAKLPMKYRILFPDESRAYKVDILEASLEKDSVWLNGVRFEFSAETMTCAEAMKRCWTNLTGILSSIESQQGQLRSSLSAFDTCWTTFEDAYLNELIRIEAAPMELIMIAIEHEEELQDLENKHGPETAATMSEYRDTQRKLVQNIVHLNSLVKFQVSHVDDLSVEILWNSIDTIEHCNQAENRGEDPELLQATESWCRNVVDSFLALRRYFRSVSRCLERVNPHLCDNVGFAERMADWEDSWKFGKAYLQSEVFANGIMDLVAGFRMAQEVVPDLKRMCETKLQNIEGARTQLKSYSTCCQV
eukprot:TRINITY_DN20299_c4_g1_i1.p1 TRINITY_DN20299_c4_g1~~TRINITY_DN20299_c4_g1_i1.p1  ORF type:complete len:450 (+),score=74.55 TRINITY_DN20299_c4_g1_i1:112-1350(+)